MRLLSAPEINSKTSPTDTCNLTDRTSSHHCTSASLSSSSANHHHSITASVSVPTVNSSTSATSTTTSHNSNSSPLHNEETTPQKICHRSNTLPCRGTTAAYSSISQYEHDLTATASTSSDFILVSSYTSISH